MLIRSDETVHAVCFFQSMIFWPPGHKYILELIQKCRTAKATHRFVLNNNMFSLVILSGHQGSDIAKKKVFPATIATFLTRMNYMH